jgi:hypothetical protein
MSEVSDAMVGEGSDRRGGNEKEAEEEEEEEDWST